jgi:hypothetical protein
VLEGVRDSRLRSTFGRARRAVMAASDEIGPIQEYEALRQELLDSKRYVFERPLLIAGGIATLGAVNGEYVAAVPPLVMMFLLFNLWLTANRLRSTSRIVAYIQLALEEKKFGPWKGWERCIREYRKWNKDPKPMREGVDAEPDMTAGTDALGYYPPIYLLHFGIAFLAVVGSLLFVFLGTARLAIPCLAVTLLLFIWFVTSLYKYRPKVVRAGIEESRVIWEHVLTRMSSDLDVSTPGPPSAHGHPLPPATDGVLLWVPAATPIERLDEIVHGKWILVRSAA